MARFVIDDTSLCFVNCHLAAGQKHIRQRNRNISAMLNSNSVFPATDILEESCIFVNGGDGTMILDHEAVFVSSHSFIEDCF